VSAAQTHGRLAAGDLLAAARAGDGEAFRALVSPHLPALHLHAYRMLGSLDDADDAVQDVLLSAWRALGAYEGTAPRTAPACHWTTASGRSWTGSPTPGSAATSPPWPRCCART
jgi:hypothetical protein